MDSYTGRGLAVARLPATLTRLIGREREVAAVRALLRDGSSRLVTLLGPGGVGKTRLALQIAAESADDSPDGVVLVELAAIRDGTFLPAKLAQALGVQLTGNRPVIDAITIALSDTDLLVVLDNLEQLVDTGPVIVDLLAGCPRLRVLVTSRIALRLSGEVTFPVPPLTIPDATRPIPDAEIGRFDGITLFVEPSAAVRLGFALTRENQAAVIEICQRVDGIPLAIELAAARSAVLPPAALLARLDRRLPLLTRGSRYAPVRLQTMRDAIAWSYDLLPPEEQRLLRHLAVCAGGCTLDAADDVVGNEVTGEVGESPALVFDDISSLVSKSLLLISDGGEGELPISMLETIREFAWDQLTASGEAEAVQERHAVVFLSLAEEAHPALTGPIQADWLNRLGIEHDNFRAALSWSLARAPDLALRLAAALWRFWYMRGHFREGRTWLSRALTASNEPAIVRGDALHAAGVLATVQGDTDDAELLLTEGLNLYRDHQDRSGVASILNALGDLVSNRGDVILAAARYEEALALFTGVENQRGRAVVLTNLGNLAWDLGEQARATVLHEESRQLYEAIRDQRGIAWAATNLGLLALEQGDVTKARSLLQAALAHYLAISDEFGVAEILDGFAGIAARQEHDHEATRLFATATAMRARMGAQLGPSDETRRDAVIAAVKQRLGSTFATMWAEGTERSVDDAVAAVGALSAPPPILVRPPPVEASTPDRHDRLTAREVDVVRFVAAGASNQAIADALFIGLPTVKAHLTNIFNKLDMRSRAALTNYAHRHGLVASRAAPADAADPRR